MATSTIFNFSFNNSEIVDSTGQWYDATTGTPTTEFINHDGNTALFQPALTNGARITPNPTMLRSYDPNFSAYTYTLEVQVCAVLNRVSNSSFILNFPIGIDAGDVASALGLFYDQNDTLEMWIDYASEGYTIHPVLIDFSTAGFDRWFSIRIERTVTDPNNPYTGATVKAYVDGTEVYNRTFTYAQSTIRGKIGPRLRYCENLYATGGIAIDNLKLTAGIAPSSVVDVSLANLQRNNANLLNFIKGKVPAVNDGTLTIQKNGTNVATFTANQSTAATANITVPTAVSELTNDSGYLTASSNLDASKLTSGTVDIARLPQGALERLIKVANEAARYALTTADVQLGDTVQQLDTGIMYVVTDTDHLDSAAGYTEYTAGTAASVPWSGVTGKPTFAAVATSGAYSDLTGTPTIPTVNNATLTIQRNGTTIDTFTANASVDKTINISTVDDTKIPLAGSNQISGDLIPSTDGTVNLGSPSYQWNNAYIKSLTINGVACGDILTHNASEFVDVTGAQTIAGVKSFKDTIIRNVGNFTAGEAPATQISCMVLRHTNDNGTHSANTILSYMFNTGETMCELTQNPCIGSIARTWFRTNTDGTYSIYSYTKNGSLGTSGYQWKDVQTEKINGLNPGALSLPNVTDNAITVDTTNFIWNAEWTYTPVFDGWLVVLVPVSSATKRRYALKQGLMSYWYSNQNGEIFRFSMPVVKGVSVNFAFISDINEPAAPTIKLLKAQGSV